MIVMTFALSLSLSSQTTGSIDHDGVSNDTRTPSLCFPLILSFFFTTDTAARIDHDRVSNDTPSLFFTSSFLLFFFTT